MEMDETGLENLYNPSAEKKNTNKKVSRLYGMKSRGENGAW